MEKLSIYSKACWLIKRGGAYITYDKHTHSHLLTYKNKTYILNQKVYDRLIDNEMIVSIK